MKKLSFALLAVTVTVLACQKNDSNPEATVTTVPTPENVASRACASDEILQEQIASDPARGRALEELEEKTRTYQGRTGRYFAGTLYVPVVVQIVLPDPTKVSDDQIRSQIAVLNADFNKNNSEFANGATPYLANYDPAKVANCDIQYVVTNIKRTASTVATFGSNDAVKKTSTGGSDPIDATTKMNIWVCDLSSGLLGYAQFPGGASATDGIVIDYQAFGTSASYPMYAQFNKGRTATHEVGHWVNLRHIWGDRRCGDDLVGDTPSHDGSNGGCPSSTLRSACSGKPLEQWMNYMDYTDDRCMYMFSDGQKARINAAIDLSSRKNYFLSTEPTSIL